MIKINPFLDLPDVILYVIITFLKPPTFRVSILCNQIETLNSTIKKSLENEREGLWSMILNEYKTSNERKQTHSYRNSKAKQGVPFSASSPSSKYTSKCGQIIARRSSKRLRQRITAKKEVQNAHKHLFEQTEIAHYFVTELAHSSKRPLSLKELRFVLNRYGGPLLRYNHRALVGGTFLIECCRARHVGERVILSCVKELIEKRGALPDVSSGVGPADDGKGGLTPLCISSARGMSLVVRYLLKKGASVDLRGTGSFRLFSNPNKSISGTFTPLEFAKTMRNAEIECGLNMNDLNSLNSCISMLSKKENKK